MSDPIDALLDQIKNPSTRAAISAGWELGRGLPTGNGEVSTQLRKGIEKEARSLSQTMGLDASVVYGAALLSAALTRVLSQ